MVSLKNKIDGHKYYELKYPEPTFFFNGWVLFYSLKDYSKMENRINENPYKNISYEICEWNLRSKIYYRSYI